MGQTITPSLHLTADRSLLVRAAERWRCYVENTFTIFGRLVYLGSLLDLNSGDFLHAGLELRCGKKDAHQAIQDAYETTLRVWLSYDAAQQEREIRRYFAALEGSGSEA
jgi:hypothetical protein